MSESPEKSAWVVGEALMDLIPTAGGTTEPMVGGGPANTAKAVSRLGYKTFFIGGISDDDYGSVIDSELRESGVDLSLAHRKNLPTALAIAAIDANGLARYEFELEGTASFDFSRSWLPTGTPDVIHIGSVATLLEPGSSELLQWVSEISALVIFDPNVRPAIESDKDRYRAAIERWIKVADVIKLSSDDLEWLYGSAGDAAIAQWLQDGASLVILTRAEHGLSAYSVSVSVEVPSVSVEVVDTVGAGDTIGAILVEGILKYGLESLLENQLMAVLQRATKAAGITCSRAGANPPWLHELDRV